VFYFGDLFNANWSRWQNVVFILLIIFVSLMIIFLIVFVVINKVKSENEAERIAKKIELYEKELEAKRLTLEHDNQLKKTELDKTLDILKEKEAETSQAEMKADSIRLKLAEKEAEIKKLLATAEMTKKELANYQKREGTNVSEDVAVNAITERTITNSKRKMDANQIPLTETEDFTFFDIDSYLKAKEKTLVSESTGKKPFNYKIENRTYALLIDQGDGKIKLTFKCGPAYGSQLKSYLPDNVSESKFPYGLLWFTVTNETKPCSLELIKQLVDISYAIAKLGY